MTDTPKDDRDIEARELKPCPFCGCTETKQTVFRNTAWVECSECRTYGPIASEIVGAIAAWNARPAPEALGAAGVVTPSDDEIINLRIDAFDMPPLEFAKKMRELFAKSKGEQRG